ncbi:hypothetical protein PPACK8108_LOCUS18127, partial [Phakopsora pachyrhizi]
MRSQAGSVPGPIFGVCAQDTGAILKDVYNAKTKLVRAQRSGRTPLENLYYELI